MGNIFSLPHLSRPFSGTVQLPASKSESNRALIINALCGGTASLSNLSAARDTRTMQRLLEENGPVADVLDAGTTMRFLTAFYAVSGQEKTLTGTPRMQQRPIGLLVEALRTLGADIAYEKNEGFPPLKIRGFQYTGKNEISLRGDVSSQFISALLLVAPTLPEGLTLHLTGPLGSVPYIEMTMALMRRFGAEVQADWPTQTLHVSPRPYTNQEFAVEADWSAASYWYGFVALGPEGSAVTLPGLKRDSLQGDAVLARFMPQLGVETAFTETGVRLTQVPARQCFEYDFTDCPDLAQTVAVVCALRQIPATFTGLESLKVKETDRVRAVQEQLNRIGAALTETEPSHRYEIPVRPLHAPDGPMDTYDDHRMAMAFSLLCTRFPVEIRDPDVVVKSYPNFWEETAKLFAGESQGENVSSEGGLAMG